MGKFFLLTTAVLLSISLAAQPPSLTQLREQIKSETNTIRKAELLVRSARVGLAQDPGQAFNDLQEALGIYKDADNAAGLIEVYLTLSNYYNLQNNIPTSISFDTLALRKALELKDERSLFQVYNNLSVHYGRLDSVDRAFTYINKALQYSASFPATPAVASAYSRLGNLYVRKGNIKRGISLTDTALSMIRQNNGPPQLLGAFLMNKASFLEQLGKYAAAAPLYYEAIRVKEKLNQPRDLLATYGSLSNFYRKTGNLPESFKYSQLQLGIARQLKDARFEGHASSSLGGYYAEKKQGDSALWYYNKALAVFQQANLKQLQAGVYLGISRYYYESGKYEEALKNMELGEKTNPPAVSSRISEAADDLLKGKILNKLGRQKEAEVLLLRSLHIHQQTGVASIQQTYQSLYEYYKSQGNYEEALKYQTDFINTKDSLFNKDIEREIVKARANYEIEKRDNLLTIERKDKALRSVELAKRNQLLLLLGILLLVVAAALVLYIRSYYLKKKSALELAGKNHRIETLIRELHHRVKNNLQVVSSLLALQSNRLENETARQAMEEGRARVDAMAMIHQRLYMDDELASVDMEDYLKKLSQSLANSFGYSNSHIETRVQMRQKTLDVDLAVPIGLIVNELMTNAFKHAFAAIDNPRVSVTLQMEENNILSLRVADNGKGMKGEITPDDHHSFGMRLVHTLVKQLDATMEVKQLNGTIFDIRIRA